MYSFKNIFQFSGENAHKHSHTHIHTKWNGKCRSFLCVIGICSVCTNYMTKLMKLIFEAVLLLALSSLCVYCIFFSLGEIQTLFANKRCKISVMRLNTQIISAISFSIVQQNIFFCGLLTNGISESRW